MIVSDRCKVVAISLPSSALGHKEGCTSPSLQYVCAKARLAQHLDCWSPHLLFNLLFVVLKLKSIHGITRKSINGQKHAISISQSGNQGGNAIKRK
ncbi:uncharacterized protein [Nicotiana sylvestris]|uniref:Uncharacterized protein LOC104218532 isoform X2 n=1 Tax=Nicotiana sylvestris TaxID=4096 RepID=A0A1U7VGZ7_NICSY|nr:PREDICTED: uncharacterized protein LOC104218532 isoform X2 [Nicotiana sylvestris]XP_009767357.1 PREDICTED: uncharacterized protein LOC104218532 isoform X2 [Nicotiana sylvestris]XP_009767358.1 PREDICTED: uncharacterized protein LOC104218532 isoform X2 [Nicotiana sylvestris]XP_009767359.1 PREDICTED: uncharacterized protein LOC104218532 isoform X3 [Nicotiana sylvestris]